MGEACLESLGSTRSEKAAPATSRGGMFGSGLSLLVDAVRPLALGAPGRFDFLAALAAQQAHKATDGMLLPPRRFHDLRQRRTLGALHHRDDLGLLVSAFALVAGLLACRLLRGLRL